MRRPLLALALACCALGCTKKDPGTFISVQLTGMLEPGDTITNLNVKVDLASGGSELRKVVEQGNVTLPSSFVLDLVKGEGRVTVTVYALNGTLPIAEKTETADVVRGQTTDLVFNLSRTTVDGGMPDGPTPDAAIVDAGPSFPLTVVVEGGGRISSNPPGMTCVDISGTESRCTGDFFGSVTLTAELQNGSNRMFVGWMDGACSATFTHRTCALTVTTATALRAAMQDLDGNLIFVSSASYPANTGAAGFDTQCNTLATAAGLNNATNDGFVAWIGALNAGMAISRNATTPLATGGIRNLDRYAVVADKTALTMHKFMAPIRFNENGESVPATTRVWTGAEGSGNHTVTPNCEGWTTASSTIRGTTGSPFAGPALWSALDELPCNERHPVYCVGRTSTVGVVPLSTMGLSTKQMFLTPETMGNDPQTACTNAKPLGVGAVRPVVATNTLTPVMQLDPTILYVRPDGTAAIFGADLATHGWLTGPWQQGNGNYIGPGEVWTGTIAPNAVGSSNCTNWTGSGTGHTGLVGFLSQTWHVTTRVCSDPIHFLCVEL